MNETNKQLLAQRQHHVKRPTKCMTDISVTRTYMTGFDSDPRGNNSTGSHGDIHLGLVVIDV